MSAISFLASLVGWQKKHPTALEEEKPYVFQYGEHSNRLAPTIAAAKSRLAYATPEGIRWSNADVSENPAAISHYGVHDTGVSCLAVTGSGRAVVGMIVGENDHDAALRNVNVMEDGKPTPVWTRGPADAEDVDPAPYRRRPAMGRELKPGTTKSGARCRLPSTAKAAASHRRIIRDGNDSFCRERSMNRSEPLRSLGPKFMPTRPTMHIYDIDGKESRKFGPEHFLLRSGAIWRSRETAPRCSLIRIIGPVPDWAASPIFRRMTMRRTLYVLPVNSGDRAGDPLSRRDFGCGHRRTSHGRRVLEWPGLFVGRESTADQIAGGWDRCRRRESGADVGGRESDSLSRPRSACCACSMETDMSYGKTISPSPRNMAKGHGCTRSIRRRKLVPAFGETPAAAIPATPEISSSSKRRMA